MTRRSAVPSRTSRARRGAPQRTRPAPERAITRLGFQMFHLLPTPIGAPVIALPRADRSLRMYALVRAAPRAPVAA